MTPEEVEKKLIKRIPFSCPLSIDKLWEMHDPSSFRDFNAIRYHDLPNVYDLRMLLPVSLRYIPCRTALCVQRVDDPDLIPHRDFMIPCSITHYLQTDGASKLVFWESPENDTQKTNKAPAVYNIKDYPDLKRTYIDTPKQGETVLLNNSWIHSVERDRKEDRVMLQFQYPFPYKIILSKIIHGA